MTRHAMLHRLNRTSQFTSSRGKGFVQLAVGIVLATCLSTFAQQPKISGANSFAALRPGEIIYADSGNAVQGGFIIKVDPVTGNQSVIASGGNLVRPFDVKLDAHGQLIVADTGQFGAVIRIDPATGQQTLLKGSSQKTLGVPFGLAVTRDGAVLVANAEAIVRVDLTTGETRVAASGGGLLHPSGVALEKNGALFALARAATPEILRIDSNDGAQTPVTRGGLLKNPQALVVKGDDLYVTDVADPGGNFGVGRIIHINARTGDQTVLSEGGLLVGPVGIGFDDKGALIVGDPYTVNRDSHDLYDGGIIRIDPRTGTQTLIARGRGSFVNPRGVVIVPEDSVQKQLTVK